MVEYVRQTGVADMPELCDWDSDASDEDLEYVAQHMFEIVSEEVHCDFIPGIVAARSPAEDALIAPEVGKILERFGKTSLSGICPEDTPENPLPIRGPFGEAEIWLKPDAVPVNVAPYHITWDRKSAWVRLVERGYSG